MGCVWAPPQAIPFLKQKPLFPMTSTPANSLRTQQTQGNVFFFSMAPCAFHPDGPFPCCLCKPASSSASFAGRVADAAHHVPKPAMAACMISHLTSPPLAHLCTQYCEDDDASRYTCLNCGVDIANNSAVIWSGHMGFNKPAFLLRGTTGNVVPISKPRTERQVCSGSGVVPEGDALRWGTQACARH